MNDNASKLNLKSLMRRHKVTIKELSQRTGLTQKAIRRLRATERVSYCTYCDMTQAVTGQNVFNLARYYAICAQSR